METNNGIKKFGYGIFLMFGAVLIKALVRNFLPQISAISDSPNITDFVFLLTQAANAITFTGSIMGLGYMSFGAMDIFFDGYFFGGHGNLDYIPVLKYADKTRTKKLKIPYFDDLSLDDTIAKNVLNPIEEAKGYRALQDVYGMTQDDVAQSVGKSRPAVANATRLLALSEPVLKLVEDGTLSAGHARALLPLSDPEMQLAAAKTVIEKGLSVRRAEALAAQLLKDTQEKPAKKAAGVDYLGECARHLEQVLGRKVRMTQGRKTGRIELEYYDADDREALLQALEAIGRRN